VYPVRNILIINPNTTASVSALLQQHGQSIAGTQGRVRVVTARFGAPYISCEASYAVAGHAALDAWAQALASDAARPDAVLVGCFGDPGLFALREASGVPVTGLAEAALTEAARHGRFAIVTGGVRWKPMLERLAQSLGFGDMLGGILTVAPTGAQLAQDPVAAHSFLADACQQAVKNFKASAIVLGGAGLAGLAAHLQPLVSVPVIDSVSAGVRQAILLAGQAPGQGQFTSRLEEITPWLGMH
jgi:allantoin racemase